MAVRKLPLGIAISVAVHVGAVAWLATPGEAHVRPAPRPEVTHVEILPPRQPEPEPVAVALLDEPTLRELDPAVRPPAPAPSPARSGSRAPAPPGAAAIVATTSPGRPASEPPAGTAGGRPSLLTMRGPEIARGPSEPWVDEFLARSKPLAAPVEASGQLVPSGGGRHRSNQGTFTLDVEPDGTAHITDSRNLRVHLALPSIKDVGNALSQWAEDPYGEQAARRQRAGDHKPTGGDDKPSSSNIVPVPVIGGSFDVTDALMRRHGQDPYASKKLRVLDATRDERAQIGATYRRAQLARAPQMMKASLDRLWASSLPLADKKRALFELWDDCAEAGAAELVDAGAGARALLIGFVNARLPAGSDAAFSADELARLNARRQSRVPFAPYATAPDAGP